MVKYDYRCEKCGKQFEHESSYSDNKKPKCPECRSSKVRKIILPSSVVYRGEGFTKKIEPDE